ncbi:toll/interleukin-1 receptor domain-containing protein [Streptomyces sp. DG2A-72]|uniref:toll/interleukin-1 receptor domain-containing protein n=1 Tax=Streptomyces sp. DG2A-72 TaxID=3051386 RepID=UPI00265C283A|nr:toll/interleukin-1 receptor domain-containing protein [Streptomyces sp. DG2A-72]MDO0936307.1 toll/interleukin-1 receptor domain-containing protein [Streptomyces sp. DG2A-72]
MSASPERPPSEWDVFVSYSRSATTQAEAVVVALRAQGLRVFVDDTAVEDFASITTTITTALARAKVLLALYSSDYPQRRACQWELTYAYLAGQREGDPRRRILVVNPEPSAEHIHPVELRDARYWPWRAEAEEANRLATRVHAHVAGLSEPMGVHTASPVVPWLPAPARTGSARFTGRLPEQWQIHTALHRHQAPLVSQAGSGRTAQLRGMPGIGKSLLAQEYALRFSSAFPGGVFWFDLHTDEPEDLGAVTRTVDAYADQVATVLAALGIDATDTSLSRLLSRLAIHLGEQNAPCLWVVDGVPNGLTNTQFHQLLGPHLLAATLITTRSLHYAAFAEPIDVAPLPDDDGLTLITSRHTPADESEQHAALALVHDVGGHPHALDVLADLAASTGFGRARERLHAPGGDVLTGSPPRDRTSGRLAASLLTRPLTGHGPVDDVLRLLALACPAPLHQSTLENVLAAVSPYDPWEACPLVAEAVESLLGSGALRPDPVLSHTWTIHPLLARAVRRHDIDTARQEDLRRLLLHALAAVPAPTARPPLPSTQALRDPSAKHRGPGPIERAAAFDLQVELVTRVGVQPLAPDQGSLREALTSLHALFATTREVLHRVATETAAPLILPRTAAALANEHLRPFLSTWHPALQQHEAKRPDGASPTAHEHAWERAAEMRADLDRLRLPLTRIAARLAELTGVDLLTELPPDER